jgi:hypothetical protein
VFESMIWDERVAFILNDVFGCRFTEVAEITGRRPAACRQLASTARRRVRASVDGCRGVVVNQVRGGTRADHSPDCRTLRRESRVALLQEAAEITYRRPCAWCTGKALIALGSALRRAGRRADAHVDGS